MNALKTHERDSVLTLVRAEHSFRDIERRLGICRKTISRYAKKAGLFSGKSRAVDLEGATTGAVNHNPEAEGSSASASSFSCIVVVEAPKHALSACAPYRTWIEHQALLGRNAVEIYQNLVERFGFQHRYNSVKRFVRAFRKKAPEDYKGAAERWIAEIIYGSRSLEMIKPELNDAVNLADLLRYARNGRLKERKKAAVILARKRGIPNATIASIVHSDITTTRNYFKIYCNEGLSSLFGPRPPRSDVRAGDIEKAGRVLELLHHKPSSFGINRTSWTKKTLTLAYRTQYSEPISRCTLTRLIKKVGYGWKKARRVLSSPDPDYHEKVVRLLKVLRSLTADELFFFIDEWGPIQVKKRGGKAYRSIEQATLIPRRQTTKGSVALVGALSATTNEITWLFEPSKNTRSIVNLLEILYNQYHTKSRIYVTWDAVSWHSSVELTDWLDSFNVASRRASAGPIIEFAPLPISAQFLNVIEGVFTAMTKAVIDNSDYHSSEEMKLAISRHFYERNAYFKENPMRVGKKIWDLDFFHDRESLIQGNYGKW